MQSWFLAAAAAVILIFSPSAKADLAGRTTRYWDCCKASCSWSNKAPVSAPVKTCSADGRSSVPADTTSACGGGGLPGKAYMCNNQQPSQINSSLAFGFAAAHLASSSENAWCCACYEMTFAAGTPVAGKKFVVQVTNTGGDLGANHFDLQIPGGGVGIFNGCQSQWHSPADGWGQRYGGVSSASQCDQLPSELRSGCRFRFDWMHAADNPAIQFHRVRCPRSLIGKSGCHRNDESTVQDARYENL